MKKFLIFASAVACLVVSGCVKDRKDFADDRVSFSAITGTLDTRTDYGVNGTVGGQSVTYVNWVAGDKIKILSSTGSSDTYTVSEDHDGSDQQGISKGNVTPDNNGIAWGTGQQTFYAMYPAPTNGSGTSLTSSTMTCVIPATWTPANETELGQLPYGYMFAKTTTSRTTSVSLTFDPKFTSFTFTLKNPTSSAVTLSSFTLSSASKAMNGTYTVNTSNGNVGTLPTAGNNNKSITVNLSSLNGGSGLSIPAGTTANPGTKTFTLVTVPDAFNDLTISCTIDGVTTTRGLKKNNSYLSFAAGLKHNISITIPGAAPVENSFTIPFGGGTASGRNAIQIQTFSSTMYSTNVRQIFQDEEYVSNVCTPSPTSGGYPVVKVFSNYIGLCSYATAGLSSNRNRAGIFFTLQNDYIKTPTKIEINCSSKSANSQLYIAFNSSTTNSVFTPYNDCTPTIALYSGSDTPNTPKTLTIDTIPPLPSGGLTNIKIMNVSTSSSNPLSSLNDADVINIFYVKVYY